MPISGHEESPAERLNTLFAKQANDATPTQRLSVRDWQGKDERFYREVQRAAQNQTASARAYDVMDDLQDLMAELPEEVQVWRGIRNIDAALGVPNDRLESLIDLDRDIPMFFATSLDRNVAETEFTTPGLRPAVYKIHAQSGTPALWVPPLGLQSDAYQQELLFPPGIVMRIVGVARAYSVPIVEVEVRDGEVGR
ncbi:hypothetical protein [Mycobacterium talmoniae]|uniref:ADP ribosyltransferase domain-containing protein n=1 Tax=Mycobacterium talmoniae TaxID=1858794 RepID=A0A1S1NR47_9MYCO|nr:MULTISPECIES: hypothetical protein [Mycobacterium]OHV05340.1 hypothetical protein BKN37_06230 [Mycobacterium talmoniae]PQM45814.1 hypothetical protein C1Y40_04025 [Mycobacterium talmoniae]TDH48410.1 hypothetical protein E2F47_23870 [Mycobacterium eburneum]